MNIKHRVRINPRMVERANNARRKARRAPIPPMKIESDKRPAMIDKIVQQEIDETAAALMAMTAAIAATSGG
jgi:hypothetical protein